MYFCSYSQIVALAHYQNITPSFPQGVERESMDVDLPNQSLINITNNVAVTRREILPAHLGSDICEQVHN
jgi:hypothetical protein